MRPCGYQQPYAYCRLRRVFLWSGTQLIGRPTAEVYDGVTETVGWQLTDDAIHSALHISLPSTFILKPLPL